MDKLFSFVDERLTSALSDLPDGATRFAVEAQIKGLRKRVSTSSQRAVARKAALDAFSDFHYSRVDLQLSNPVLIRAAQLLRGWLSVSLDEASWMHPDNLEALMANNLRPGPGSAVSPTKSTSGFLKRSCPLYFSHESAAVEYLRLVAKHRPDLMKVVREHGCGLAEGRISTVVKNDEIDRVILIEPSGNVELQQGFAAILNCVLLKVGIDLRTQPDVNRHLARMGSLNHGYGTADLSRASDSLCLDLLRFLLPEWVVESVVLYSSRVPGPDGRVILTMGNAITFPLQTLIFLAIACASCRSCGLKYTVSKNVSVFGDDIVVPSEAFSTLTLALEQAGLTVNRKKSFNEGPFRESCGLDCYLGYSVRPFSPQIVIDDYTRRHVAYFVNGIAAWAYKIGLDIKIPLLIRLAQKHYHLPFVPMHAPIDSGIRITRASSQAAYRGSMWWYPMLASKCAKPRKARWNSYLIQAMLEGWVINGVIQERADHVDVEVKQCSSLPWDYVQLDELRHYAGLGSAQ